MSLYQVPHTSVFTPFRESLLNSLAICLIGSTAFGFPSILSAETSKLWGDNGELWDSAGPLPDFSFAGYQRGEKPIPENQAEVSVQKFGAKGDGKTDDTEAFQKAIAESGGMVIEIPEGRFVITGILEIKKSGTVLRGAGPDKTVFICPTPLETIKPSPIQHPNAKTKYSWSGGIIWVFGSSFGYETLGEIEGEAKRGDRVIEVASAKGLKKGQDIIVHLRDDDSRSLLSYVYAGEPGDLTAITKASEYRQFCRIIKIEGKKIHLDRPLRYDLKAAWKPELRKYDPGLQEVGIEGIGFEFPANDYEGHFSEQGYNAIAAQQVAHCWIRNIKINNADSGITLGEGTFCTISGITISSERQPDDKQDCTGHHGISVTGNDNLVIDFDFQTKLIHDLTVTHSVGNVFSNGKGTDLSLDHHRLGPYENLFSNLDVGIGSRVFMSGGRRGIGQHCGAGETFWNIQSKDKISWPDDFGPDRINWIGVGTGERKSSDQSGRWIEKIKPGSIQPADLHEAQLERRLNPGSGITAENSDPKTMRPWINSEGKEIRARFIALEGETLILEMQNKNKVRYPLKKLSAGSQELARKLESR